MGRDETAGTMTTTAALTPELKAKQQYCRNCDSDFYNHGGHSMNGSHCWHLEDARVVTRFKLHWWTAPTVPGAYQKVDTLDCHTERGQFAFHKELPPFAVDCRS